MSTARILGAREAAINNWREAADSLKELIGWGVPGPDPTRILLFSRTLLHISFDLWLCAMIVPLVWGAVFLFLPLRPFLPFFSLSFFPLFVLFNTCACTYWGTNPLFYIIHIVSCCSQFLSALYCPCWEKLQLSFIKILDMCLLFCKSPWWKHLVTTELVQSGQIQRREGEIWVWWWRILSYCCWVLESSCPSRFWWLWWKGWRSDRLGGGAELGIIAVKMKSMIWLINRRSLWKYRKCNFVVSPFVASKIMTICMAS